MFQRHRNHFLLKVILAGMTVALHDVVLLGRLLHSCPDLSNSSHVSSLLKQWHWSRKPLSSTINILSVALYDLFGADGACSYVSLEQSGHSS